MRDDDEGAAACIEFLQNGGDQSLPACGIQPCRRLIKQEDWRV